MNYKRMLRVLRRVKEDPSVVIRALRSFSPNIKLKRAERIKHVVETVANSERFDHAFYSRAVGRKFLSRNDAAQHYVVTGEADGYRPSKRFDPVLYANLYPDVHSLKGGLLAHYEQHGRREGRVPGLDLDALEIPGDRPFSVGRPTVAVVTHELSETGAPILAWNLIKEIPDDWNVISISLRGGPLKDAFAQASTAFFGLDDLNVEGMAIELLATKVLKPICDKFGVTHLLLNTAVTYKMSSAAERIGIPTVMLIHEFSEYLPYNMIRTSVVMSDHIVFSSRLTKQSAEEATGLSLSKASIFPQGRSAIPLIASSAGGRGRLERLLELGADNRFLVIGCGHFQIRKGVDGFVSAAKRVADALGRERVLFAWVGNGYDPENDHAYSVWIKDQIRRSDLEEVVQIIPGLDGNDLAALYDGADAMFLSSRLDPFPNVAIDAISLGLPIVCYAEASGVAEHLLTLQDGERLVAPYLDVAEAAARLIALAQDSQLRSRVTSQLKTFADENFSFQKYVERLLAALPLASERAAASTRNTDLIVRSGVVDLEFLNSPDSDNSTRSAVAEYVRTELMSGDDAPGRRRLFAGHSMSAYPGPSTEVRSTERSSFGTPTVSWVAGGKKGGPWAREVIDLSAAEAKDHRAVRSALHIHAHYPEMVEDLLAEIAGNASRPDLYISASSSAGCKAIQDRVRRYDGFSRVVEVENRGRDIGPMLVDFAPALSDYDVVGHIHTKQSFDISDRRLIDRWRKFLIANMIGAETRALDKNLSLYGANPRLGLSFPEDPNLIGWTKNRDAARELLAELGIAGPLRGGIEFPVGNMFFFRPSAMRPLFARRFMAADLPSEPLPYDGTMLHALERIWTLVCESEGYEWITTRVPGIVR